MNFNAIFKNVKIVKIGLLEAKLWKNQKYRVNLQTPTSLFHFLANADESFSFDTRITQPRFENCCLIYKHRFTSIFSIKLDSSVVALSPYKRKGRGSIPRRGDFFFNWEGSWLLHFFKITMFISLINLSIYKYKVVWEKKILVWTKRWLELNNNPLNVEKVLCMYSRIPQ